MVFIHGESYTWGSGNLYDGRVLASYADVIVITFNYRIGIFGKEILSHHPTMSYLCYLLSFAGFLNTYAGPSRTPRMANYGMMDQIAVLKWIQENIVSFGGNPDSVTLFGHQTGAAFIQLLMQSPAVVPGTKPEISSYTSRPATYRAFS